MRARTDPAGAGGAYENRARFARAVPQEHREAAIRTPDEIAEVALHRRWRLLPRWSRYRDRNSLGWRIRMGTRDRRAARPCRQADSPASPRLSIPRPRSDLRARW